MGGRFAYNENEDVMKMLAKASMDNDRYRAESARHNFADALQLAQFEEEKRKNARFENEQRKLLEAQIRAQNANADRDMYAIQHPRVVAPKPGRDQWQIDRDKAAAELYRARAEAALIPKQYKDSSGRNGNGATIKFPDELTDEMKNNPDMIYQAYKGTNPGYGRELARQVAIRMHKEETAKRAKAMSGVGQWSEDEMRGMGVLPVGSVFPRNWFPGSRSPAEIQKQQTGEAPAVWYDPKIEDWWNPPYEDGAVVHPASANTEKPIDMMDIEFLRRVKKAAEMKKKNGATGG